MPLEPDDKFKSSRCIQCWDEYTEDHAGVKISSCGHIFGRDCLEDIVNGPTGDLCPYCRLKLFQPIPAMQDTRGVLLLTTLSAYCDTVSRLKTKTKDFVSIMSAGHPAVGSAVSFAFDGVAVPAEQFVRDYTSIHARNPKLNVREFFDRTTLLTALLCAGVLYIEPASLQVYVLFGIKSLKVSWAVTNLSYVLVSQASHSGYLVLVPAAEGFLAGTFDDESDRALLTIIAAIAIMIQQLCIFAWLWPASTLDFVWMALVSIMSR